MLWGSLISINRLKRQNLKDQEELAEFLRLESESVRKQIALLSARLDSLEALLAKPSEAKGGVAADGFERAPTRVHSAFLGNPALWYGVLS